MTIQPAASVRPPAIAGTFYPADAQTLAAMVDKYLSDARDDGLNPKALIAPHAGLIYSGPVAGSAYKSIARRAG